jgi:hypothetical protein
VAPSDAATPDHGFRGSVGILRGIRSLGLLCGVILEGIYTIAREPGSGRTRILVSFCFRLYLRLCLLEPKQTYLIISQTTTYRSQWHTRTSSMI